MTAMDRWSGTWEFDDATSPHHGKTGQATITAPTKFDAEQAVKEDASRELFGSRMMTPYIVVNSITKLPQQ